MGDLKILKVPERKDNPKIFENLKGRRFVAISIAQEDADGKTYQHHVNHMSDEEVVYAASLLLNQIFGEE